MTNKSKVWIPKPNAPPYIPVTQKDIWDQVRGKWTDLGSPEAQCPSPQFGAVGSVENNECRRRVAPLWENFENLIPDTPTIGPYNNLQDLVSVEEVCALGFYEDPEADIGPAPNLFTDPGGLARKLVEWYLRSKVKTYCDPVDTLPNEGGCFCWPYFVTVRYRSKTLPGAEWSEPAESRSAAFGPIRGVRLVGPIPRESGNGSDFRIVVMGQRNPGGIIYGDTGDCTLEYQDYGNSGFSNFHDVELMELVNVEPFTTADMDFYGKSYDSVPRDSDGYCPVPPVLPPLPPTPNSKPFYMPLPVPSFIFPQPDYCAPPDMPNVTFNLNVPEGPMGPPGADGKDGKPGPTMIKTTEQVASVVTQWDIPGGTGDKGGVYNLYQDTAYVVIEFKVDGASQSNYRERRIFFEPISDDFRRKEMSLGNVYLRLSGMNDGSTERIELSHSHHLVEVPESPPGRSWVLVVSDKSDAGFRIVDMGYRHVLRRIENPDDVPSASYSEPN